MIVVGQGFPNGNSGMISTADVLLIDSFLEFCLNLGKSNIGG
jgi:hypothetical protein